MSGADVDVRTWTSAVVCLTPDGIEPWCAIPGSSMQLIAELVRLII